MAGKEEIMIVSRPGGLEAVYTKDKDGNTHREVRKAKAKRGARAADAAVSDDSGVRSLSSESKGE